MKLLLVNFRKRGQKYKGIEEGPLWRGLPKAPPESFNYQEDVKHSKPGRNLCGSIVLQETNDIS